MGLAVSLGIDVEQDDIGTATCGALDVRQQQRILDLGLVEKCTSALAFARNGIDRFAILQQIRILMKCDLPEPKKPDTQTPMREVSTVSLGLSNAARYESKKRRK